MKKTGKLSRLPLFLTIMGLWMLVGLFTACYEFFFLANYPGVLNTPAMGEYNLANAALAAVIWGALGGFLFAYLEIFVLQNKFRRQPFSRVVLIKGGLYVLMLTVLNIFISFLFNSFLAGRAVSDPQVWQNVKAFVYSTAFWHPLFPFFGLTLLTLFIMQISQRFGQGEMMKMLGGRYFQPKEEKRIFMFLDLKSSTAIAEKLGHGQFFNLINDFFHDITDTIIAYRGEIYDYVGDEIIVCWTTTNGIDSANCLQCFFAIEEVIATREDYYKGKYGMVPEFKAGLHLGYATVGEIGRVKKSISYSGDVLNTASRIQSICNDYNEKLLISEDLSSSLVDKPNLNINKIGTIPLKGKEKPVDIYAVKK